MSGSRKGLRRPALAKATAGRRQQSGVATAAPDDELLAAAAVLDRVAGSASPEAVRNAVSAATRLYASAVERAGGEIPPVGPEITTTDALTLSCALLRSQHLTPFDMAMWFGRGARSPVSSQERP